ncbi:MAG: phosphoglucosamine mutase [Vulcanimicrobiota bacterium]
MSKLFGTDGVRGVANQELTPETVFAIGRAHGYFLRQQHDRRPTVVVGRDSRLSGPMLEAAYVAGATSSGADLILAGIIPTPGVAHLVQVLECQGGAVLSASHNPIADNGIKLFRADGYKLDDAQCREFEKLIARTAELPRPTGADIGQVLPSDNVAQIYRDYLGQKGQRLEGLKLVLDCAHGAACGHAAEVFAALGAEVVLLSSQADGNLINVKCGSTDLTQMAEAVVRQGAALGLAFDGDADRCLAVDEQGQEIDGDHIMLILASWLKRQNKLAANLVVATVMSNLGLELALRQLGIELVRAQVGDRYVLEEMQKAGAVLGGEQSGHILLLDRSTSGDGILTGLTLAGVLVESGLALSALAQDMQRLPQKLVNVPARNKELLFSDAEIQAGIEAMEKRLESRGRILVRPSGTEPLVRVMVEGSDQSELDSVLDELASLLRDRLS